MAAEETLVAEILAELRRARAKFPGDNVTTLALVEEVGELAKATFEESRARVREEAVQVAVMAMRVVLDGDQTLDAWRAAKGLDALTEAREVTKGCRGGCAYSRALNQPYPRLCVRCGNSEQTDALKEEVQKLRAALDLASVRLDFAANWLENSYKAPARDVLLVRQYAAAARLQQG